MFENEFWLLIKDVWENGIMGIEVGQIALGLFIVAVSYLLRGPFSKYIVSRIEKLTEKTKTDIDNIAITALRGPIRFIPILVGTFIAIRVIGPTGSAEEFFSNVMRTLTSFTMFWAFISLVNPFAFLLDGMKRFVTSSMINWLLILVKTIIVSFGAYVVLNIWGIQIGPILAGFGVFGLAIGLGAQDLFKNIISGGTVLTEQRMNVGDWVKIEGVVEGIVEKVGLRSTTIRQFNKVPVYVPNADFASKPLINFSEMTFRQIKFEFGLVYDATEEQIRNVCERTEKYIRTQRGNHGVPVFATEDDGCTTFVRWRSFGASSLNCLVYCFTHTTNWIEWLDISQDLNFALKRIVEEEGTAMAFNTLTLDAPSLDKIALVHETQAMVKKAAE